MLNQTSEELIVSAPPGTEKTPKQSLKPRKLTTRTFDFLWRRNSRREDIQKKEDALEVKIVECNVNNTVPRKTSFSFFKNIKNHIQIKKLSVCKEKEKVSIKKCWLCFRSKNHFYRRMKFNYPVQKTKQTVIC